MSNERHVIFGTGAIGLSIMDALLAEGKSVRLVNRSGNANVPEGVEVIGGDASDLSFATRISAGASVIYNALNPPYEKWEQLFPPLQDSLITAAATVDAKLVSLENTYMYGKASSMPLTEDLPYHADTRKGRVRAQMAATLLAAHQSGKIRAVIGRASDFFGPRATVASIIGDRAIYPALDGKAAQLIFKPDQPHTYTYVPDIGKALVILGEHDSALGQVWHLPSPETVTTREILEIVYQEIGHKTKISVMPKLLFHTLKQFMPIIREMDEMMYEFEEPFFVDHSKFDAQFGDLLQPAPLHQAIRETIAWFKANPQPSKHVA